MREQWEIHWKDYYKILQVDSSAEPEVIDGAYIRLAKKYAPDVNNDPSANKRMTEINEAKEVLKDPERRKRYHEEWFRRSSGSNNFYTSYTKRSTDPPKSAPPPRPEPPPPTKPESPPSPKPKPFTTRGVLHRKRGVIIAAGAFLLLVALVLVLLGINSPTLVGKWQDTQDTATIEFTKTGEYIVRDVDFTDAGTYELIGRDTVKVTLSDNFSYTFPYTISGNTMKTLDAQAMTFERISP